MKLRMLLACLLLGLGTATWLGCRSNGPAEPVGLGSNDGGLAVSEPGADGGLTMSKPNSGSGGHVNANFDMRAVAKVHAETDGCSNSTGPNITLNGELALEGVNAKLIFSNNANFTHMHEEDAVVDVVLLPEGETIKFAKQPSRGGTGGNPWIYLVFTDEDGEHYGKPQLLGRCVQGLFSSTTSLAIPSGASAEVTSGGCTNSGGPTISIDGELAIGGLSAQLIFTNNRKFRHVHEEDIVVSIVIIPKGESIEFAKQPPNGGAGGNPHIFMQFETGNGSALSDVFYLGRCVQLSK